MTQKVPCAHYYEHIVGKRVLIIGLEPPPFGGISVHVQRVARQLAQSNTVKIFDIIKKHHKRSKVKYWLLLVKQLYTFRPQIIYYHVLFLRSGFTELLTLGLFARLFCASLVLVEHSARFLYTRSWLYRYLLNKFMVFVDQQVLIGLPMLTAYQKNGIILRRHIIESSFVPPVTDNELVIFAQYPKDLHKFLVKNRFILLMNASKFGFWNGQDIYGFDFCIQLMCDLVGSDITLIIAVGTIYDYDHYELIKQQINNDPRIYLLVNHQQELWPLIKRVNVLIRPSRYDNSSLSVAEAVWFGIPAIASDITERPLGCRLFKTDDYNDFVLRIWEVYEHATSKHYCTNEKSL